MRLIKILISFLCLSVFFSSYGTTRQFKKEEGIPRLRHSKNRFEFIPKDAPWVEFVDIFMYGEPEAFGKDGKPDLYLYDRNNNGRYLDTKKRYEPGEVYIDLPPQDGIPDMDMIDFEKWRYFNSIIKKFNQN